MADQGNDRVLRILAKDAALKAGVQFLEDSRNAEARPTVEDQLLKSCEELGLDFMLVSNEDGRALAAVIRQGGRLLPLNPSQELQPARHGYFSERKRHLPRSQPFLSN